jgi:hypothetical protein
MVDVNRQAAETALELYSDCMRWLLLVGGGYECQESEGTFMMAFSGAGVAIEWCLMVQQVLRDMSWPPRWVAVQLVVLLVLLVHWWSADRDICAVCCRLHVTLL